MTRVPRTARCLLLAFASIPAIAVAGTWQPLATGTRWEYRGVGGAHQVETITGQTIVRGRLVSVKSYAEGSDAGLQNYWLLAADGSVLLAGFLNPSTATGWAYEPPIRYLPVPPAVGEQPFQTVDVYDLLTNVLQFHGRFRYDVTEDVTLSLPAGSFHAFGVGRVIPLPGPALGKGEGMTLDGRRLPGADPSIYIIDTTDWYSEDVGVVQYQTGDLYQLVNFGLPTPTAKSSWAAIKKLYR